MHTERQRQPTSVVIHKLFADANPITQRLKGGARQGGRCPACAGDRASEIDGRDIGKLLAQKKFHAASLELRPVQSDENPMTFHRQNLSVFGRGADLNAAP